MVRVKIEIGNDGESREYNDFIGQACVDFDEELNKILEKEHGVKVAKESRKMKPGIPNKVSQGTKATEVQ